ncbi:YhzD family protein [Pseudalkalibacillus decolorationis]|uniref:YhzD family protein n=1 Tax=Pseudalkalibacillus decolorationis TaxID=163879 RepID=UPI0021494A39|nr:YhzD family protein [Pseudalkalibacillus decolorationis]
MKMYIVTVFEKSGEKIYEESFEAADNNEAKKTGQKILEENNYENHTSRVTSPAGELVLFHR